MTVFLRLLNFKDKHAALLNCTTNYRQGGCVREIMTVDTKEFDAIPGSPFSYWVSADVRNLFPALSPLESEGRNAAIGLSTKYDARFVRCFWEVSQEKIGLTNKWIRYANGSKNAKYYVDYNVIVNGINNFAELREYIKWKFPYLNGNASWILHDENNYGVPVIAWPLRTGSFSPNMLPAGFVFSARTYAAFVPPTEMAPLQSLLSSKACDFLIKLSLGQSEGQPEFVTNAVRVLPIPQYDTARYELEKFALRGWTLTREVNTVEEISHSFLLPAALRSRLNCYDPAAIEAELVVIQAEIDEIAYTLYGFSDIDRAAIQASGGSATDENAAEDDAGDDEGDDEDSANPIGQTDGLLSWTVGVAFGRFDWRLATGERAAPPEPDPFDPLPAKSPGMLPDGDEPFHAHTGILVDDPGHKHDLAHLVEEVLARVDAPAPNDVHRWLQREFFAFHLQNYSKSRRKAPIYWPLSTASGAYTLWVYYPNLTSQTLYTAINDFLEGPSGKLKQVEQEAAALRAKSARSRDEDKKLEAAENLEAELIDLRDTLLRIAPTYHPNHDDGVQITAAPLWPLFRHKPWQKLLKDTWTKLEKGDYDWAHLALVYWPDRVREKCKTDKSLAIAHDLEGLYVEPEPNPAKKRRGAK
ncbi:hypothetical protein QM467_01485 [Rhodoblastus sp. 17X3]|uniref:hypothetical protein n=1 Tax=Rhodoblastus sp. 17X3 TaxID=3047026 RepID=UPI0024B75672|nr:hypothetical protein [Rhodoblastus sp. 17X3]MDI9846726.1 hypothetical protein [Rhodoblastus sp. 17X3]